jgi:transposase
MSQRELERLEVVQRVCRKALTQRQAADLLSLSVRQVRRLLSAYRREGVAPNHPWRDFNYSEESIAAREQRGELCRLRK